MTTTYLITGSAGFIGSNLCHHLIKQKNTRVIGIDNLSTGSAITYMPFINKNGFSFVFCDIRDASTLHTIISEFKPNIVIHLAAASHVDRSITSPYLFWETNVLGTTTLLECCRNSNVGLFINQVSDEAFGPIPQGCESYEDNLFNPTSPYAGSKVAQYFVGKTYYETYGVPVISTFPSNTFGPRQWPEKLIPKFIIKLHRNEKVPLMKSINNERDWLSVDDHCRALIEISKHGMVGKRYNIGGNRLISNIEITNKLLKLMGKKEDMIEIVEDRLAHDSRYFVNTDKIEREIGWQPIDPFEDYLKKTVEWYIERADYYPKEL